MINKPGPYLPMAQELLYMAHECEGIDANVVKTRSYTDYGTH